MLFRSKPGVISFTAARNELKGSYWVMSSEIEKSKLFKDPGYLFANQNSAKNQNWFQNVRKDYALAYKRATEGV